MLAAVVNTAIAFSIFTPAPLGWWMLATGMSAVPALTRFGFIWWFGEFVADQPPDDR